MNRLISILVVVLVLLVSILGGGVYYSMNSPMPTPTTTPTPFPPPTSTITPTPTPSTGPEPTATPMSTPSFEVDASWVSEVLWLLEEAKPYTGESPKPGYHLSYARIYVIENDVEQLVLHGGPKIEFISYLEARLLEINLQILDSISRENLKSLLDTSRFVRLNYRFPLDIHGREHFDSAIFVIDSPSDPDLEGSIFIPKDLNEVRTWSRWVITRGPVSKEQAIAVGRAFFTQINVPTGQVLSVSYERKQPNYYWYDNQGLPRPSFDSDMPRACWVIEYEQPQRPGHVVVVYVDATTGISIGGIQCK